MFWLFLSIVAIVGIFIGIGTLTKRFSPIQFLSLLGLLLLIPGFLAIVPANSVGIAYSPFGGTREATISEGVHSKNLFDRIYTISTEVQSVTVENLTTQTKDAQFLNSTLDIKYRVSADNAFVVFKQYRTLDRMSNNLVVPTTQRVMELITTKYNVIDVLGEDRGQLYGELEQSLKDEFAKYGIDFYSISITDMDAGEALEKAITDEAVAKKSVETAEQNLLKTQTEAKQKSVEAQAEQDAMRIKAETKKIEAEAEKEANELVNQTLTDEILREKWIEKWNGEMPTYYGGDASIMIGAESVAK